MNPQNEILPTSLSKLQLDGKNPRFGGNVDVETPQKLLLEAIVEGHGVNDLLASMSTNGYFKAEPVVAVPDNGLYTVVEGNRRLAAALILTGEERASQYQDVTRRWSTPDNKDIISSLQEIPVSVFQERDKNLIAYLGSRHIRGSKQWDSYAKAHWLFELMSESNLQLTIKIAAQLIGDPGSNTIRKILEAYVLMRQLRNERGYQTDTSKVPGRGSNPDYPFSWVYTSLSYENIRSWISIDGFGLDAKIDENTKVVKSEKALENSKKLVLFLFGSKFDEGSPDPVVRESREIRKLSEVVNEPDAVRKLERGSSLDDVCDDLKPANTRLDKLWFDVRQDLRKINELVSGENYQLDDLLRYKKWGEKSQIMINSIVDTQNKKIENASIVDTQNKKIENASIVDIQNKNIENAK